MTKKKRQKVKTEFTPDEDKTLCAMKDEGRSYNYIAEVLGRSRNSIIGHWHGVLKKKLVVFVGE